MMKQIRLVEPVVILYCFATFLSFPINQQYIYQRLWIEEFNSTVPYSGNGSQCETNHSNPNYIHQKEVQKKASYFSIKLDLSALIPSLVMSLILVSYGDRHGRKMSLLLPSVGGLLSVAVYFSASFFALPLQILYLSTVISGFFGSFATFLGGCFSYVADLAKDVKSKNIRIAFLDMVLGVSSGVAGIASGYFLQQLGFKLSFGIPAILHIVNIFYIVFLLEETVKKSEFRQSILSKEGLKEVFSGVYYMFKHSSSKKRVTLSLLLCAFMLYLFANFGPSTVLTLYELGSPLCWDSVLVGWGSALSTFGFVTSFLGVYLFSRCLKDPYIVSIGMISCITGAIVAAFATTTVSMMLVRLPFLFAAMPLPVLRSMMSKVVLEHEQGALFACIACLESLTGILTLAIFNSVYASTVMWFPGFSFLLSAGLTLIPFGILWLVSCIGYEESSHVLLVNESISTEEES
uniref:Lysosomal proton-coupled steroid conjugate and bile acid symporter SLC46A3 n=1 Tax=Leptobrachium leishanense TaxID=445787 RepID=A0A8C5WET8_9ANUR